MPALSRESKNYKSSLKIPHSGDTESLDVASKTDTKTDRNGQKGRQKIDTIYIMCHLSHVTSHVAYCVTPVTRNLSLRPFKNFPDH